MDPNGTAGTYDVSAQEPSGTARTPTTADAIAPDELTRFQFDVLVAIERSDPRTGDDVAYGLGIKRWLEAYYDGTEVNHGRLYPNLDTLVELGLVERGTLDKRTNSYELTPAAYELLRRRAQTLVGAIDGGDEP